MSTVEKSTLLIFMNTKLEKVDKKTYIKMAAYKSCLFVFHESNKDGVF
jgi:hypothetical protein